MKIKNSVNKLNKKSMLAVFFAAMIICLPVRFYQQAKLIDVSTGFITGGTVTKIVLYGVIAVSCLAIMAVSFLGKDPVSISPKDFNRNKKFGIAGILVSVSLLLESIYCLGMSLMADSAIPYSADTNAFSQGMKNGQYPFRLASFFAFVSAIYFLCLSIGCFKKVNKTASKKIFGILPVFWGILRMITFFVKQISFIRISDLVLEIAATVLITIFLLSLAQCLSGIYVKEAAWRIAGIGLPAALIAVVLNLPKLFFTIFDSTKIVQEYPMNYAELFLGIYIIILVTDVLSAEKAE